jgi:hypothetical protein
VVAVQQVEDHHMVSHTLRVLEVQVEEEQEQLVHRELEQQVQQILAAVVVEVI